VVWVVAGVRAQRVESVNALETGLHSIETDAPDGKSAALLGMIYNDLGRPDQALRWLEVVRRSDRRPAKYDGYIGDCWTAVGDYEKANAAYQRAIDLHPERLEGLVGKSHLRLLNAEFSQARTVCRQNLSLDQEATNNARLAAQIEFFGRNFTEAQRLYTYLDQKNPVAGG